jgi:hypothetical protein
MKNRDVFKIALQNIEADKKASLRMVFCLTVLMFLVTAYTYTWIAFLDFGYDFEEKHNNSKYIIKSNITSIDEANQILQKLESRGSDVKGELLTTDGSYLVNGLDGCFETEKKKLLFKDDTVLKIYFENYRDIAKLTEDSISSVVTGNIDLSDIGLGKFVLTSEGRTYCAVAWIMHNVGSLLLIVGMVSLCVILMIEGYAVFFFRNRNRKYFNMLRIIGIQKKDVKKITLFESFLISVKAIVLVAYLTFLFCIILNHLVNKLLMYSIKVHLGLMIIGVVLCEIVFLIINRILGH